MSCILGIDAGTTGITVIRYDTALRPEKRVYSELTQHFPRPGWVEHDPEEIAATAIRLLRDAREDRKIAAIGITNQRETVVPVNVTTKTALGRAIVWQCRRTTEMCAEWKAQGHEPLVRAKTGLLLDPYFSATKMRWMIDHDRIVAAAADAGSLRFLTMDSWLLYVLSGREVLATDYTNASRTALFNIEQRRFDDELLELFGISHSMLPHVRPSVGLFGTSAASVVGFESPITGIAGDQQAALFGQECFDPGDAKNTYGTGCFLLQNAGELRPKAAPGVLTTLACGRRGQPVFALEGAIFIAGAAIQWLRDGLGIISSAAETEALARSVPDNGGVHFVPAFAGLSAPYWDSTARGLITGLTRGTTRAHLVRAALEAIAFQVNDLFQLFASSNSLPLPELRVDGGASANDWLLQFQADVLGVPVTRGQDVALTCRGAALLAALGAGIIVDPADVLESRPRDRFTPKLSAAERTRLRREWSAAIARTVLQP